MLNKMFDRKGKAYNADTGELMVAKTGWQDYIANVADRITGNNRYYPWGLPSFANPNEKPVKLDWGMVLQDLIQPRVPYMDFAQPTKEPYTYWTGTKDNLPYRRYE